jgi:hypothetical protein
VTSIADTALGLGAVLARFEQRLRTVVGELPLHLMCEREMRRSMAEALLDLDREFYSRVENLQYEKSGSGIPARNPVDLFFSLGGRSVFSEFKYWHTMVKMYSGKLEIGKGNCTSGDYTALKRDFARQACIENGVSIRLIFFLAQTRQYPKSQSMLPIEYARSQDEAEARVLFESMPGSHLWMNCEGRDVSFEMEQGTKEMKSAEGVPFRLFSYRVKA